MTSLRRWWRSFTAWLHDHSDDDCPHCIGLVVEGHDMAAEHLHDHALCGQCLHLMLIGYWERLRDERREHAS